MSEPCILPPNISLPRRIAAGNALAWTVETGLPPGTVVFYVLLSLSSTTTRVYFGGDGTPSGDPPIYDGVVVDSNGNADFALASSDTSGYTAARYRWHLFAIDPASGDRSPVAQGELRITPNPTATSPTDPRTYNEQVLDQIRQAIKGATLDDVQMYKIGGREITKMSRMDLLNAEAIFETRVRNERRRRGEYVPTRTIGISFGGRG